MAATALTGLVRASLAVPRVGGCLLFHGEGVACLFLFSVDVCSANGRCPHRKEMATGAVLGHLYCVGPGEWLSCPPHWQLCSGVSPGAVNEGFVLMFLLEVVLLVPCAPLTVAWSSAGRTPHCCVLPARLALAAASVADVSLG